MKLEPLVIAGLALGACAPVRGGPRAIPAGTPCAVCRMHVQDLRYACEDESAGRWRFYDSIECLLRSEPRAEHVWLPDYDTRTLHASDSVWVVHGEIPSPMGGGYASFLDRAAADEIARARRGRVARLAEHVAEPAGSPAAGSSR